MSNKYYRCDNCGNDEFYLNKVNYLESMIVKYNLETNSFEEADTCGTGTCYDLRCTNCDNWEAQEETKQLVLDYLKELE